VRWIRTESIQQCSLAIWRTARFRSEPARVIGIPNTSPNWGLVSTGMWRYVTGSSVPDVSIPHSCRICKDRKFINKWTSSAIEEEPYSRIMEKTAPMRQPKNSQFSKLLGKSKSKDLYIYIYIYILIHAISLCCYNNNMPDSEGNLTKHFHMWIARNDFKNAGYME
jgi:hypothetical protein